MLGYRLKDGVFVCEYAVKISKKARRFASGSELHVPESLDFVFLCLPIRGCVRKTILGV